MGKYTPKSQKLSLSLLNYQSYKFLSQNSFVPIIFGYLFLKNSFKLDGVVGPFRELLPISVDDPEGVEVKEGEEHLGKFDRCLVENFHRVEGQDEEDED